MGAETGEPTFTVDELAARAGVTVRTIRFYSTRGLLPPPVIGPRRVGRYGPGHLSRLALIEELQHQGMTLAADRAVSGAAAAGAERTRPGHPPGTGGVLGTGFRRGGDAGRAGAPGRPAAEPRSDIDRLAAMGVLERAEAADVYRVDPGLLRLGVELLDVPIAHETILAARTVLVEHTRTAAQELTALFRDEVWNPYRERESDPEQVAAMRSLSAHMRPLVVQALVTAFQRSLKEELRAAFSTGRARGGQRSATARPAPTRP